MLKRVNRLNRAEGIKRVLKNGKFVRTDHFSLRALRNNLEKNRFGFIVSGKEIKNATTRNLLKRRAREIIRTNLSDAKKGYDVLFIFLKRAAFLSFEELRDRLLESLKRLGIL